MLLIKPVDGQSILLDVGRYDSRMIRLMTLLGKRWCSVDSKELYLAAKCRAKAKVYAAKKRDEEQKFANILRRNDKKKEIFKVELSRWWKLIRMLLEEKYVFGMIAFTDDAKKRPGNLVTSNYWMKNLTGTRAFSQKSTHCKVQPSG